MHDVWRKNCLFVELYCLELWENGNIFKNAISNTLNVLLMTVDENFICHFTNYFDKNSLYQINKNLLMCKLAKVITFET